MYAIIINNKIFAACETQDDVDAYINDHPNAIYVPAPNDFKTFEYVYDNGSVRKKTESETINEYLLLQALSNRATEYPPIGDQLDALWKGGEAAAEMLAKVQAVKAKYPKPE
jgi:hypothetical protein